MRDRDLVLPPSTFAYVLDSTKGRVNVYVGPHKTSLAGTDRLVVWDDSDQTFNIEDSLDAATQTFTRASEGEYIILSNPAANDDKPHPPPTTNTDAVDLRAGEKIVIPGPASFPLWPGQTAQTIAGHHLKSNQYLLVRVYEPNAAREYAQSAVVAPQTPPGDEKKGDEKAKVKAKSEARGDGFVHGQLLIKKGIDVSFYIPSTGLEVLPDEDGKYVRDAATLERLEYAILLDEDGNKRYVQGPDVVFPEPTEQFVLSADNEPKARAIELNAQSGLYIKVIADYQNEENFTLDSLRGGQILKVVPGQQVLEGDELFITGKHTPIYFPRPEHMILMYRNQRKHHAIAIPRGEGRYVLDRAEGSVNLIKGPKMFLADPRTQVIVQRILEPDVVKVMYPGNEVAVKINHALAQEQQNVESVLTGQELATASESMHTKSPMPPAQVEGAQYLSGGAFSALASSVMPEAASAEQVMRSSSKKARRAASQGQGNLGETGFRGTKFTKPRTIVLDTKYQGAVEVEPWPGYAVLITNRAGDRRVEVGPKSILLEYDESLMRLTLSKGRPKNDRNLFSTVYLRTLNNQVTDQVVVETSDMVGYAIDVSYRVNFVGETEEARLKWFDVENYVQLLCDSNRSRLRNAAKRHDVKTFHEDYIDIIRDALLGTTPKDGKRPGRDFEENGMRLYDVEVLDKQILDPNVNQLLDEATKTAMAGAIRLAQAEDESEREARFEDLKRLQVAEVERTREVEHQSLLASIERSLQAGLNDVTAGFQVAEAKTQQQELERQTERLDQEQELNLQELLNTVELTRLKGETDEMLRRLDKVGGTMVQAIAEFGDKEFVGRVMTALAPAAAAAGIPVVDLFNQWFKDTPFEGITEALSDRPFAPKNAGNGHQLAERVT